MILENIASKILELTSTFNPKIVIFLFLLCLIGEIFIPVPYVLETVWLIVGYQVAGGILSPSHLIFLWFVVLVGRLGGAVILYNLAKFGNIQLVRFYKKRFKLKKNSTTSKMFRRISLSPFSIALGRLWGLKFPITIALGIKRRLKELSLGILLSSLVFDGIFIFLGGAVGTTVKLKPIQLFLYSLIGVTIIYLINFIIQRLILLSLKNKKNIMKY